MSYIEIGMDELCLRTRGVGLPRHDARVGVEDDEARFPLGAALGVAFDVALHNIWGGVKDGAIRLRASIAGWVFLSYLY